MRPFALARIPRFFVLFVVLSTAAVADEPGWIELAGPKGLEAWKAPTADWMVAGSVKIHPDNAKLLSVQPGKDLIVNGEKGRTTNLLSKQNFADVEAHVEFLIPKGSNAGVKFEGLYEIQILDSWGVKTPKAMDCGGIYPRAELLPTYHYLDSGFPPKVNACKAPGEWQTLDIVFRAPRFDSSGKKTSNARFDKVVLNGVLIHENQEVSSPTGHAWKNKEIPEGPILLQADHGPVAFRSVRVRSLDPSKKQRQ